MERHPLDGEKIFTKYIPDMGSYSKYTKKSYNSVAKQDKIKQNSLLFNIMFVRFIHVSFCCGLFISIAVATPLD